MFGNFQIQINIVLCILLICLFFHAFYKMNHKKITNRLFMWIMGLTSGILIFEVFSVIFNVPGRMDWIIFNKLVNLTGFMIAPIIPFLGYLFCREWIKRFQKHKQIQINNMKGESKSQKSVIQIKYILFLPIITNAIFLLINYRGGQLYFITDNNVYMRGPLFFMLPVISFIYFMISLYFIFNNYKKYTFSERILFSMIFLIPAFFTAIQIINFSYLTIWNSTAIVVIITYIIILYDQIYRDNLTGLENRLAYEQYARQLEDRKLKGICMIYMDIDNFKTINDCFGHSEGDEALKIFADLIIGSFQLRHKKILRVGGDEFMIILKNEKQEKIDECLNSLMKKTEEYNNSKEKSYRIDYSFGIEQYSDAFENMNQLMDHVDHMMYKHKKSKVKKKEDTI